MSTTDVSVRTLDGLHLAGTLVEPRQPTSRAIVLVHGGGVTREEGGFFTRLADGLADAGVASLRFDLRGHGQSEGRQEDLTLSSILNDIRVVLAYLQEATGAGELSLLGTSFTGGVCAYYAAKQPQEITRLVLFNPQLNYKRRTIDRRPFWVDDHLTDEAATQLTEQGYLLHSPTLKHGRAIYSEVFWLRPHEALGEVQAPTLIVHGTKDTFVPIESSRAAVEEFGGPCKLVEIEGAQHGFAVHDDPQYLDPQSQEWQAFVIRTVADWVTHDG
ncbi:alpha/beta fold hydrolase [Streptomyces sp. NPDC048663]|uniref:alpha/beta hydrolase n=1 Tax=Streptomyces sp. NPDC048663 TaxID=3155638 RepID=UPI00342B8EED